MVPRDAFTPACRTAPTAFAVPLTGRTAREAWGPVYWTFWLRVGGLRWRGGPSPGFGYFSSAEEGARAPRSPGARRSAPCALTAAGARGRAPPPAGEPAFLPGARFCLRLTVRTRSPTARRRFAARVRSVQRGPAPDRTPSAAEGRPGARLLPGGCLLPYVPVPCSYTRLPLRFLGWCLCENSSDTQVWLFLDRPRAIAVPITVALEQGLESGGVRFPPVFKDSFRVLAFPCVSWSQLLGFCKSD